MTANHRLLIKLLTLFICLTGLIAANNLSSSTYAAEIQGGRSVSAAVLLKNQEYFPTLIKVIDEAKTEIFISIFLFKAGVKKNSYPDKIVEHLAQAVKRGVRVAVILENSGGHDRKLDQDNGRTRDILMRYGVEVYYDSPRKTTHTKLVVIDQRFVMLGSHNFTQAALKHNNEISVLLDQPDMAGEARNYMLKIAKEAR
jgi:phosphatidylserine/phosphatidylglycerophosphate/cardiolipin synthase-like enzyme